MSHLAAHARLCRVLAQTENELGTSATRLMTRHQWLEWLLEKRNALIARIVAAGSLFMTGSEQDKEIASTVDFDLLLAQFKYVVKRREELKTELRQAHRGFRKVALSRDEVVPELLDVSASLPDFSMAIDSPQCERSASEQNESESLESSESPVRVATPVKARNKRSRANILVWLKSQKSEDTETRPLELPAHVNEAGESLDAAATPQDRRSKRKSDRSHTLGRPAKRSRDVE